MVTPGVCIAASASGTGKTTIATGLMAALARTHTVAPFKVGPDYIDPGYHALAAGRVGRNLDSVMCGTSLLGPLYVHGSQGADIGVVEGVMGLFDGRITDQVYTDYAPGSTAEVAAILGLPVVLVVDVRGMSQSVGAAVKGFATAADGVRVAGVILNKVGTSRHEAVCRSAVESQGIPVLGALPRVDKVEVPSRHLGLVTAAEHGSAAMQAVEQRVPGDPVVAVAGGPAFTFAYAEHAELLEAAGAKVVHFDPLKDPLPHCDGLVIPGGFPEEHVENLSSRHDLQDAVRAHVAAGKPVHGECAGLLWLLESLDAYPMLGVIDTHAAMGRRLTLGYRDAVALTDSVLFRAGERITGHEFHHTALTSQEVAGWDSAWGWHAWDGRAVREGFSRGNIHASYMHCHPASLPQAVERFVRACVDARTSAS